MSDPDDEEDTAPVFFVTEQMDDVLLALRRNLGRGHCAVVHDADCDIDAEGGGCSCEPITVVGTVRNVGKA